MTGDQPLTEFIFISIDSWIRTAKAIKLNSTKVLISDYQIPYNKNQLL